jgi:hypothetical protein
LENPAAFRSSVILIACDSPFAIPNTALSMDASLFTVLMT